MRISLVHFLTAGLIAFLATGCTRHGSDSHSNQGGQDGGGGHIQRSTPDEVRAAIRQAFRLASEKDLRINVFVAFWKDWGQEKIPDHSHLFPAMVKRGYADIHDINLKRWIYEYEPSDFASPFIDALNHNTLILKDDGDCGASKDNHADASVSAFNVNADICFSVGNLTRLPPSSLLREILSLVLHETTHLGGANEEQAQNWQNNFSEYFASRFGSLSTDDVIGRTAYALARLKDRLHEASHGDATLPIKYTATGQMHELLLGLPYFLDPLRLDLSLKPAHPELVNNYSNLVLSLIFEVGMFLEPTKEKGGDDISDNKMRQELDDRLRRIQTKLDILIGNFFAYVGAKDMETEPSVCVLLGEGLSIIVLDEMYPGISPVAPPHECAPGTVEKKLPDDAT